MQPRCTNNPLHGKATIVHHLKYKRSIFRRVLGLLLIHSPKASIAGFEIPGWDVVGVCARCHSNTYGRSSDKCSVHHKSVWLKPGGINNRQTFLKKWELRIKFFVLWVFGGIGMR